MGEEAFSVIREAMVKSMTRAISRVVLYHRERAVLLEPRDKGMVLWTLRYGDEVRDEAEYVQSSAVAGCGGGWRRACHGGKSRLLSW